MAPQSPFTLFCGGDHGQWQVVSRTTLAGPAMPAFPRLAIGPDAPHGCAAWCMRAFTSNQRYTSARERRSLNDLAAPAGRETRTAVLIPMSKSAVWWTMAQDERLAVFARSRHTQIGLTVLPAVARRLYHARDLGEPFDFLTWFEFEAADEPAFDAMLATLRASEEWDYVTAESELRLARSD